MITAKEVAQKLADCCPNNILPLVAGGAWAGGMMALATAEPGTALWLLLAEASGGAVLGAGAGYVVGRSIGFFCGRFVETTDSEPTYIAVRWPNYTPVISV